MTPILQQLALIFAAAITSVPAADAAKIALAPDLPLRTYSAEEGLNQRDAVALAQDDTGYLWIGTFGGLNRFDGATFESFTTRHGLRENFIQDLYVDSQDRLWAGDSSGGVTMLKDGRVMLTVEPPQSHHGTIRDMFEHHGMLYMGLEPSGLTRMSLSHPERGIEFLTAEPGRVLKIVAQSEEQLLVFGSEGLFSFEPNRGAGLKRLKHEITAIAGNPQNGIFVGNDQGQVGRLLDGEVKWFAQDYGAAIWHLRMSDSELVWVQTYESIMPFGRPDKKILLRRASDALVDRDGISWFVSNDGLSRYLGERFEHFSLETGDLQPEVFSIQPDARGGYWFGADQGLLYADASGNLRDITKELDLPAREIRSLALSSDEKSLWVASVDGGVYRVSPETMTSERVSTGEKVAIMGLTLDNRDRVWAGSYSGILSMHDPATNVQTEFNLGRGASIYSPTIAADGMLWFSVNHKGIYRLDINLDGAQPELVISVEDIGRPLIMHVVAADADSGGEAIWFSTVQGGVFRYRGGRLERVVNDSRLSDQTVYAIQPLSDATIVLTTNKGAYRYDLTTHQLASYGSLDGFVGIEGNAHANYVESEQFLWLGTGKGAARMDVSLPMDDAQPPPPTITKIVANGEPMGVKSSAPSEVDGKKLLVEYVAVSTRAPEGIEYSYRVGGADDAWSAPTTNRSIGFSSLAPGRYVFEVRARRGENAWSPTDSWTFIVPTPFWRTGWFIGLAFFLALGLARAGVELRLRAVAAANQRLRELVEERTRSIEQGRHELIQTNDKLSSEIAERERSDALRADVEARFHQAYQNSPVGMALVDLDLLVYDANPKIKMLFWPNSRLTDKESLLKIIVDTDRERLEDFLKRFAAGEQVRPRMEVDCLSSDDSIHRIDFMPSAVRNPAGDLKYIVLLANDVTESRAMTRQLEYQASFDELTGLINRRAYNARLDAICQTVMQGKSAYLMFLDLDQFKVVNDTCGHAAGDELLRNVAEIINNCVREHDIVARLGGDEFALILVGCTEQVALARADQVRQSIQDFEFYWNSEVFRIGVSIGVVPINGATHDVAELQQIADAACYAAKEAGRNRVHMVDSEQDSVHEQRGEMRWVQRLNHAIDTDSFVLFGQRLKTLHADDDPHERIEVLLRLNDRAANRLVPPGAFLPAAERYGLQDKLDLWVVNRVIDVLHAQGQDELARRRFWVNLSGASVSDPNFSNALIERIAACDVPPGTLNFEITETAVIRKISGAARLVSALREMGCKFALDDFGSGLSSFGYIKRLELDVIKIDGEFIRDIVNDPTDRIFVKSIIDIAHTLGMKVVAEFVENEEIYQMVQELGADFAQGFGVHRPEALENLVPITSSLIQSGGQP